MGELFRYSEMKKERLKIIEMRQCDAEKEGIIRETRWRVKNKKH